MNHTGRTKAARALGAFLKDNGITFDAAASAIGTTKSSICQWIQGPGRPREPFRDAIQKWTGGAILKADWLTKEEAKAANDVVPYVAAPEKTGT